MGSDGAERRRLALLAAGLGVCVAVIAAATLGAGPSAPSAVPSPAMTTPVVPLTASNVPAGFWADTVVVDSVDYHTLSVHSVRHPDLPPYKIEITNDTILMAPGDLLDPQPGIQPGSRFYFTGTEESAEPVPYLVKALRVFEGL